MGGKIKGSPNFDENQKFLSKFKLCICCARVGVARGWGAVGFVYTNLVRHVCSYWFVRVFLYNGIRQRDESCFPKLVIIDNNSSLVIMENEQ